MSFKEQLQKLEIPHYSKKQETFNVISHALGLPIGFFILVFALIKLLKVEITPFYFFGLLIFSLSAFTVYLVSALYHRFPAHSLDLYHRTGRIRTLGTHGQRLGMEPRPEGAAAHGRKGPRCVPRSQRRPGRMERHPPPGQGHRGPQDNEGNTRI